MIRRSFRSLHGGCLLIAILAASARGDTDQPSQDCFIPRFDNPEYCVGPRPLSVATGDLDGDGNLDLVAGLQLDVSADSIAVGAALPSARASVVSDSRVSV